MKKLFFNETTTYHKCYSTNTCHPYKIQNMVKFLITVLLVLLESGKFLFFFNTKITLIRKINYDQVVTIWKSHLACLACRLSDFELILFQVYWHVLGFERTGHRSLNFVFPKRSAKFRVTTLFPLSYLDLPCISLFLHLFFVLFSLFVCFFFRKWIVNR